jgi:hypothetical protein
MTIQEVYKASEKIEKEFEEAKKKYDKDRVELKRNCPHDYQFEPDPSGNNDSGYYCSACGSWRRKLP